MLNKLIFCFVYLFILKTASSQSVYKINSSRSSSELTSNAPWGVQFNPIAPHLNIYYGEWNEIELANTIDSLVYHASKMGVKWVRFSINWSSIQDTNGKFHWNYTDRVVTKLTEKKINIIICLNGGHKKFTKNTSVKGNKELAAWSIMADSISMRYAKDVKYWEIWNEPNTKWFWKPLPVAKEYYELVKIANATLKKNIPDVKILGGSVARLDLPFSDTLIKLGILNYIDIFSIHPYNEFPEAIIKPIKTPVKVPIQYIEADHSVYDLKNLLQKKGTTIWQAECGYPSSANSLGWTGNGPWGDTIQAKWLLRRFMTDMIIGSKISIFFTLIDYEEGNPNKYNSKGLLTLNTFKPKASYYVFQNTASVLQGNIVAEQAQSIINKIEHVGSFNGIMKDDIFQTSLKNEKYNYFAYWLGWRMQEQVKPATIEINIKSFKQAVMIDLIKGEYYKLIPNSNGNAMVKLYDYPIIIAEESAVL